MDMYIIEFRIESSSLEPREVTNLLGLQPCQTMSAIDNKHGKRYRTPFWAYDGFSSETNFIEQEWDSLEDGLLFLLDKLSPKLEIIRTSFSECKTYWWCGHFQKSFDGGPNFSANLLKKLADFGSELLLRTYPHSEE